MRSRYTAFVLGDDLHVLRTWDESTRPGAVPHRGRTWAGLTVGQTRRDGPGRATVSYRAHSDPDDGAGPSVGAFRRDDDGDWRYVGPA